MISESYINLIALIENDLGQGQNSGRWMKFYCPFHRGQRGEKELTLIVTNGDRSRPPFWKCLACDNRGGAISWALKYRKLTYREAVDFLRIGTNPVIRPRWEPITQRQK